MQVEARLKSLPPEQATLLRNHIGNKRHLQLHLLHSMYSTQENNATKRTAAQKVNAHKTDAELMPPPPRPIPKASQNGFAKAPVNVNSKKCKEHSTTVEQHQAKRRVIDLTGDTHNELSAVLTQQKSVRKEPLPDKIQHQLEWRKVLAKIPTQQSIGYIEPLITSPHQGIKRWQPPIPTPHQGLNPKGPSTPNIQQDIQRGYSLTTITQQGIQRGESPITTRQQGFHPPGYLTAIAQQGIRRNGLPVSITHPGIKRGQPPTVTAYQSPKRREPHTSSEQYGNKCQVIARPNNSGPRNKQRPTINHVPHQILPMSAFELGDNISKAQHAWLQHHQDLHKAQCLLNPPESMFLQMKKANANEARYEFQPEPTIAAATKEVKSGRYDFTWSGNNRGNIAPPSPDAIAEAECIVEADGSLRAPELPFVTEERANLLWELACHEDRVAKEASLASTS
jgi:hypothetical protein